MVITLTSGDALVTSCIVRVLFCTLAVSAMQGCATNQIRPQEAVQAPSLQPQPSDNSQPDRLSYGMVTGRVKKGETTQQDLLDLFGGPNTMTTDRDGTEVWMYDKTTTTVSGSHASSNASIRDTEAGVMAGFFGLSVPLGIGGAVGKSHTEQAATSQSQHTVTRSVKTLTFIVKFNDDQTVKDYAVRHSSF